MAASEISAFSTPQWLLLSLVLLPFFQGIILLVCKFLPRKSLGLLSCITSFVHLLTVIRLTRLLIDGLVVKISVPWLPEALIHFSLRADGLALFFSLLITGMGTLVFLYSYGFMKHEESNIRHFYAYLNIFMGSMLGAVLADNLIVLFLFWETTSVMSYLLICYEYHKNEAKQSARSAFMLNAVASLALLIGFILIGILDHTFELSQINQLGILYGEHSDWLLPIMSLLLIGIYAKSAQFPFHFWLPRAMAAPTPVSAYLHSATMVKLGVYLTARIYILFIESEFWLPIVTTLSLTTILVGGCYALFATKLKEILAYATISQLGFFISFYGLGNPTGLNYEYVHIFNHALYKGSLFMLIGILGYSTGATDIRQISGLSKRLPFLGITLLISLAAMAGIPGTSGFISKELLITDLLLLAKREPTSVFIVLGVCLGLLFKVTFTYRLFYYGFLKKTNSLIKITRTPTLSSLIPPFILSLTALILGIWPAGLEALAKSFIAADLHSASTSKIHLWHGFSINLGISLLIFMGGTYFFYFTRHIEHLVNLDRLPNFNNIWLNFLDRLPLLAKRLTQLFHHRKPEKHLLWLFSILSLITGIFLYIESPSLPYWDHLNVTNSTSLLIVASVIILLYLKHPFQQLILLSAIAFLVVLKFVLKQGPDVAMTQLVIETATLFAIILLFKQIPKPKPSKHSWGRGLLAITTGLIVAATPLFHSAINNEAQLAHFFIKNAIPLAKGSNVVNTILVDFRGLDTLGEIAVIVAATLGVAGLLLNRKTLNIPHFSSLIPSPILAFVMPSILLITFTLGIHLLLRGHNYPGGGFTGGIVPALALILMAISMKTNRFFYLTHINPFKMMMCGLAISVSATTISIAMEGVFFAAYFSSSFPSLNTPLLFDTGIFLLVLGSVIAITHTLRKRTLWEKQT